MEPPPPTLIKDPTGRLLQIVKRFFTIAFQFSDFGLKTIQGGKDRGALRHRNTRLEAWKDTWMSTIHSKFTYSTRPLH